MSGGSYDYIHRRVRVAATEIRSRTERNGRVEAVVIKVRLWEPASRAVLEYHGEEARRICAQIDAHRLWLADLLELVAQALHDVEWVDSADYGPGDEVAAIRALMRPDVSAIEGIDWPPPPPTPEPAPAPVASTTLQYLQEHAAEVYAALTGEGVVRLAEPWSQEIHGLGWYRWPVEYDQDGSRAVVEVVGQPGGKWLVRWPQWDLGTSDGAAARGWTYDTAEEARAAADRELTRRGWVLP